MYKLILKIFDLIDAKKLSIEAFPKFLKLIAKTENLSKAQQQSILTQIEQYYNANIATRNKLRKKLIDSMKSEEAEIVGKMKALITYAYTKQNQSVEKVISVIEGVVKDKISDEELQKLIEFAKTAKKDVKQKAEISKEEKIRTQKKTPINIIIEDFAKVVMPSHPILDFQAKYVKLPPTEKEIVIVMFRDDRNNIYETYENKSIEVHLEEDSAWFSNGKFNDWLFAVDLSERIQEDTFHFTLDQFYLIPSKKGWISRLKEKLKQRKGKKTN